MARPGRPYDLIAICAVAALSALLSAFSVTSEALLIPAFFCVFFAPGYALVSALFPAAKANPPAPAKDAGPLDSEIGLLERIAASVVLSMLMFAIGGISLSWTPSGLTKPAVLAEVTGLTIGLSILAIYRRASVPPGSELDISFDIGMAGKKLNLAERIVAVVAVAGLVLAGAYAVGLVPGGIGEEPHTEFGLSGPDGNLASLPQQLVTMQNATVRISLSNRMLQAVSYNLTVGVMSNGSYLNSSTIDWSRPQTFLPGNSYYEVFTVLDGQSRTMFLMFSFPVPGKYQIFFTLDYLDHQQQLWLWVDVAS